MGGEDFERRLDSSTRRDFHPVVDISAPTRRARNNSHSINFGSSGFDLNHFFLSTRRRLTKGP